VNTLIFKRIRNWLLQNLANVITISGLVVTIWLLLIALNSPNRLYLIILLAGLIGLTDFIDGKLARYLDCRTSFGSALDRIRDKIFVMPLLIILTWHHRWKITELSFFLSTLIEALVFAIILFEILLAFSWLVGLIKKLDIESNKWGKAKMFCEFLAIMFWLGSLTLEKYIGIPIIKFSIYLIILTLTTAISLAFKSLEGYYKRYTQ